MQALGKGGTKSLDYRKVYMFQDVFLRDDAGQATHMTQGRGPQAGAFRAVFCIRTW